MDCPAVLKKLKVLFNFNDVHLSLIHAQTKAIFVYWTRACVPEFADIL